MVMYGKTIYIQKRYNVGCDNVYVLQERSHPVRSDHAVIPVRASVIVL